MLTNIDHELIRKQCDLQMDTSDEAIENFTQAYYFAKLFTEVIKGDWRIVTPSVVVELIHILGKVTMPSTEGKFSLIPRTFSSGEKAVDPSLITDRVKKWATAWMEGNSSPEELYFEFEMIHPFTDGNGRVGHLLWAIDLTRRTGEWPESLPPDLFAESRAMSRTYASAFGPLED